MRVAAMDTACYCTWATPHNLYNISTCTDPHQYLTWIHVLRTMQKELKLHNPRNSIDTEHRRLPLMLAVFSIRKINKSLVLKAKKI